MDKISSARLLRVSTTRIDGGTLFGPVAKERWERFASPDRQNRIAIGNYCVLLSRPEGWVLVNVGPGDKAPLDLNVAPMRSRSSLLRELRELGLMPKDIAFVLLTHLHDEHAGGGTHMTSSGRVLPTFPNARYVVQRDALEEAFQPNERNCRHYRRDDYEPLLDSGQMEIVEGDAEVAKGLWVRPAPGPTAGHQMVVADCGERTHAFVGVLAPTSIHLRPSVVSATDRDPESTMQSKRHLHAEALAQGWYLAPVGLERWVPAWELAELADGTPATSAVAAAPPRVRQLAGVAV